MANIIRCDACGKEETIPNAVLSSPPPTWIEITEYQPGATPNEHHQVCSRFCGATLLTRPRADDAPTQELPPEPPPAAPVLTDDDIPF